MSSHVQLEKECKKHGIKPIFGCELYLAPTDKNSADGAPIKTRKKYHQTVMAADEQGYQNLNRIVTASFRDHFFQWPTTTSRLLKQYCDGLVVLSGCSDSLLSCTLLGGKESGDKRTVVEEVHFENARRVIEFYQGLFGERYFLEVQRFPKLERTRTLNATFAELSRVTGARLAATSDVHYPKIEHRKMQKVLHAAHRGGVVEDAEEGSGWDYEAADLTYPKKDREILHDLVGTGLSEAEARDAILNTSLIARECTVELPRNEPIKYPISEDDWAEW